MFFIDLNFRCRQPVESGLVWQCRYSLRD